MLTAATLPSDALNIVFGARHDPIGDRNREGPFRAADGIPQHLLFLRRNPDHRLQAAAAPGSQNRSPRGCLNERNVAAAPAESGSKLSYNSLRKRDEQFGLLFSETGTTGGRYVHDP